MAHSGNPGGTEDQAFTIEEWYRLLHRHESNRNERRWRNWRTAGLDYKKSVPKEQPLINEHMEYLRKLKGNIRDIEFLDMIGEGNYGTVWKVTANLLYSFPSGRTAQVHTDRACKIIRPKRWKNRLLEAVDVMLADVVIVRDLLHKNIVLINGYIPIPDTETGFPFSSILIFMELCDGDLESALNHMPDPFPRTDEYYHLSLWFLQMASALDYLHRKRIVHLDIKPQNILTKLDPSLQSVDHLRNDPNLMHFITFKLADFGLAIRYGATDDMIVCQSRGTPLYMAPELARLPEIYTGPPKPGNSVQTKPCDVYSLGMSLAFIYMDFITFPLKSANAFDAMNEPLVINDAPHMSVIIRSMISPDPIDRPTIEGVIQNKWVSDMKLLRVINTGE